VEFPLLGTEPFVVEFANTRYDDSGELVDFLATAELVRGWFGSYAALHRAQAIHVPARDAARVRELRDHVHRVLAALADGDHPGSESIDAVNDYAALAQSSLRLRWPEDGSPQAVEDSATSGTTRLLARLATETITLATGPGAAGLSRCVGPDCRMLFVQTHRRRRFCHPSCSQRARQARYHQRRTGKSGA
jgi:predicted RNA-binding Zn ribbon-like protein